MSALKPALPSAVSPLESARLFEARIAMSMDTTECLLGDGRRAKRAASCLTLLSAGDLVLATETAHGCHVLHILARDTDAGPLVLAAPGDGELRLRGRRLRLHAQEEAEIVAGGDLRFTSATGNLALDARNLFINVGESLIQQSRHFVGKALQYMVDARHLLKLHGKDALLTAERDIKADAERISMG